MFVTVATDNVLITVCTPSVTVAYEVWAGSCEVKVRSSVLTMVWPEMERDVAV